MSGKRPRVPISGSLEADQLPSDDADDDLALGAAAFEDAGAVRDAQDGAGPQLLQAGDIIYLSANHLPRKVGEDRRSTENYLHANGFCGVYQML